MLNKWQKGKRSIGSRTYFIINKQIIIIYHYYYYCYYHNFYFYFVFFIYRGSVFNNTLVLPCGPQTDKTQTAHTVPIHRLHIIHMANTLVYESRYTFFQTIHFHHKRLRISLDSQKSFVSLRNRSITLPEIKCI